MLRMQGALDKLDDTLLALEGGSAPPGFKTRVSDEGSSGGRSSRGTTPETSHTAWCTRDGRRQSLDLCTLWKCVAW